MKTNINNVYICKIFIYTFTFISFIIQNSYGQDWIIKNSTQFSSEALKKTPFELKALVGAPKEYLKVNEQFMEISGIETDNPSVGLLVEMNGNRAELEALGVEVGSKFGNIYTIHASIAKINDLASNSNVIKIVPSIKCELTLDQSIPDTKANEVHRCDYSESIPVYSGYTGKDVLVVTIDTGIDWAHEDFINNSTGTSRVLYLWDQTLTPLMGDHVPQDFPYGVEYTQEHINAEIDGSPENFVRSRDYNGHGTHVMGIIAGDGSSTGDSINYPAYSYVGMAPGADIIAIKSDLYTTEILDGIEYAFKKGEELNKPVIINLSLGTQFGAHDGSSLFEQAINNAIDYNRVIVVSAGNSGTDAAHGQYFHAEGNVTTGSRKTITFDVPSYSSNYSGGNDYIAVNIWYQGEDNIKVKLKSPNGDSLYANTGSYRTNVYLDDGAMEIDNASDGPDMDNGDNSCTILIWDYYSNDTPEMGQWQIEILGNYIIESGHFDAWIFESQLGNTTASFSPISASNRELISIPGTVENVLTVAAHSTKTSWNGADGESYFLEGSVLHDLAYFSSPGPTRDDPGYITGLQKPDLSAPGFGVISALSSNAYSLELQYRNADGVHLMMSGTSMSAPHVSGAVALILEKNPTLSPDEIKSLLTNNAKTDNYTGITPNYNWGYGKLDIYEAMNSILSADSPEISIVPENFNLSIPLNQILEESMGINNIGSGNLVYRLSTDLTTFIPNDKPASVNHPLMSKQERQVYTNAKYISGQTMHTMHQPLSLLDFNLSENDVFFSEGFETGVPPEGWIATHGDSATRSWSRTSNYVFSGNYGAYCHWGYDLDEWLISPALDFSGATSPAISFWWVSSYYWHVSRNHGDLFVKISTDGGITWDTLWTFGEIGSWDNWTWYQTTLDLSEYQSEPNVMIAFHILADDNADIAIDHVMITTKSWISFMPNSGRILPGESENVGIEFNTTNLLRGDYKTNIKVKSNDPINSNLLIPVTMTVLNNNPYITSIPDTIVQEENNYTYQVTASDPDGDSLTFSLLNASNWLSIDPVTGLIVGTPLNSNLGETQVTVQVSDNHGGIVSQTYRLYIIPTGTLVSGELTGILSVNQSPYIVNSDLLVPDGKELTIEPGVELRFNGPYRFIVNGRLRALGTQENHIIFTRHQPTEESRWGGIRMINTDDTTKMVFCDIVYGLVDGASLNGYGGAIYCANSILSIRNSYISNNKAYLGAGLYLQNSILFMDQTIVDYNDAIYGGSGLYFKDSQSFISNSLIYKNIHANNGGAIYYSNHNNKTAKLVNCILYGNDAHLGDGIYVAYGKILLNNCILWNNNHEDIYISSNSNSTLTVKYSNIESGIAGTGNISENPEFVNPGVQNFHLQNGSPCINQGDPHIFYNDTDGSRNDMGIYGSCGIDANFTEYDFDTIDINSDKTISFELTNLRYTPIIIDTLYLKQGIHFSINKKTPLIISPLHTDSLEITLNPVFSGDYTDSLVVVSTNFYGSTETFIKIFGRGTGEKADLAITSPNGGEMWNSGSRQLIKWTSNGPVGDLLLEYSLNGGGNWMVIDSMVINEGEYLWNVPNKLSNTCLVRISEIADQDPSDVSDEAFTLMDLTPPDKIENLVATVTDSSINLSWSEAEDNIGVEYYLVYYTTLGNVKPIEPELSTQDTFYVHSDFELETIYFYYVVAVDSSGNRGEYSNKAWAVFTDMADTEQLIPSNFSLSQNYPNPFNPSTKIKFALPNDVHVKIILYNILGQKLDIIFDNYKQAGHYELEFNALNLPSGIYYYAIQAGEFYDVKKMVLVR